MKVLVACEFSGVVRRAFAAKQHETWSCDLLRSIDDSPYHIQGNVLDHLCGGWDLMIAHPPCTYLALSGRAWFKKPGRAAKQHEALEFFKKLYYAPIPKICIENPRSLIGVRFRKHTELIQPWMFGDPEVKETCLWLRGLPRLKQTHIVYGRIPRCQHESSATIGGLTQAQRRSITYPGIAQAMAQQWG